MCILCVAQGKQIVHTTHTIRVNNNSLMILHTLCISENSTTTSSTVNITAVNVVHFETGKMPVHQKRKYQDQVSCMLTTKLLHYLIL